MRTLVLHLAGPLQSWGATSRFVKRDTIDVPTKSAVIGMLAACLGRRRGSDMSDLTELSMAARVDHAGMQMCDFHTVGAPGRGKPRLRKASGGTNKTAILTDRWYLCGARFTVALAGDDVLVEELHAAALTPFFPPYLGRRCCPPDAGWCVGVLESESPRSVLIETVPLVGTQRRDQVRIVSDAVDGELLAHNDAVRGLLNQRYGSRAVTDEICDLSHLPVVTGTLDLSEWAQKEMAHV